MLTQYHTRPSHVGRCIKKGGVNPFTMSMSQHGKTRDPPVGFSLAKISKPEKPSRREKRTAGLDRQTA